MAADGLSLLQFADRIGLNLFALLIVGFALHVALGIVERAALRDLRRSVVLSALALVLFVVFRLLILMAQLGDGTIFLDLDLLPLAWAALGSATMLAVASAGAAIAGVWLGSRIIAVVSAVGISASFGLTGHTQGLTDPGLAPVIVATHVLIAGFWVTAPLSLFPKKTLDDPTLLARLHRFSAIAVGAIPILVVLGVWLGLILTGGAERLLGTTYGLLLLVKLALGLAAMGLGAINKQVVTGRVASDPTVGRKWLRRSLLAEATLFVATIVAVSTATTIGGPSE